MSDDYEGGGDEEPEQEQETGKEAGKGTGKQSTQGKMMDAKTKALADRNAQRRKYLKWLKYLILVGVGIWYMVFGVQKLVEADEHPSTKFSADIVEGYEVPVVAACLDVSNDDTVRFDVGEVVMNGDEVICQLDAIYSNATNNAIPNCRDLIHFVDISEHSVDSGFENPDYDVDRNEWQLVRDSLEERGDQPLECAYVVPPAVLDNITDRYSGMFVEMLVFGLDTAERLDETLEDNSGARIPIFLTEQFENVVNYWAFHPSELDFTIKDFGFSVHDAVWELGQNYYATLFSFNSLTLVLETAEFPDGTSSKSYNTLLAGAPIISYSEERFFVDNETVAGVVFEMIPSTLSNKEQQGFTHHHLEYYSPYEPGDFIAGLGGAVSGVAGMIAFFLGLFMFGFAVGPLIFGGWAPIPGRKPGQLDAGAVADNAGLEL